MYTTANIWCTLFIPVFAPSICGPVCNSCWNHEWKIPCLQNSFNFLQYFLRLGKSSSYSITFHFNIHLPLPWIGFAFVILRNERRFRRICFQIFIQSIASIKILAHFLAIFSCQLFDNRRLRRGSAVWYKSLNYKGSVLMNRKIVEVVSTILQYLGSLLLIRILDYILDGKSSICICKTYMNKICEIVQDNYPLIISEDEEVIHRPQNCNTLVEIEIVVSKQCLNIWIYKVRWPFLSIHWIWSQNELVPSIDLSIFVSHNCHIDEWRDPRDEEINFARCPQIVVHSLFL